MIREPARNALSADEGMPARGAKAPKVRWSAVVFARNEAGALPDCLRSLGACAGRSQLHVTLLLNGTTDASRSMAGDVMRAAGLSCRVYTIPHADKSNAINCFLHDLRPAADTYFFVDGYASVRPDALALLASELAAKPHAHAAAAVPSTGRSAALLRGAMLAEPGLHGSLFALRASFVERMVAAGIRLPVGLYRGDGLIGSLVRHDLDALNAPWDLTRIAVQAAATWTTPQPQLWRPTEMRRQLDRRVRQAQGRMESAAIRDTIYADGFGALPADVGALILPWLDRDPEARMPRPWRDPAGYFALQALRHRPVPGLAELRPKLLFECEVMHAAEMRSAETSP